MPALYRALRFTKRRTFLSSIFGATAAATVLTVSASNLLPCPARPDKSRFADNGVDTVQLTGKVVVAKRPRRWIEEKNPTCQSH
ncbi:uncharacterized protein EV420DRAFT_1502494 [Desarmillaria tabescens]|uniref:Uncharacterized protein n=1 Tax=Armillaria tabescens TaxID=1929756 RepID=A0AA39NLV5_ARMTA|nr:uncharacterized protein EV420DRAFT_1502494 [Desarmillaria tabescens]KAK0468037.1 hypothetical protein EV420DRAFT_1502494 [Desarmillaria tabescens]